MPAHCKHLFIYQQLQKRFHTVEKKISRLQITFFIFVVRSKYLKTIRMLHYWLPEKLRDNPDIQSNAKFRAESIYDTHFGIVLVKTNDLGQMLYHV